jgi:hypothetical protein
LSTNLQKSEPADTTASDDSQVSCTLHSIVRGSIGFSIVGLAAFSVWAFGGKWFQNHLGEAGMYGACALVFIALSGVLLHPLLAGSGSLFRFYGMFIPAFLAYAIVWCIAWFALRFGPGEWLGSLLGAAAFVGVISWRLHNARGLFQTSLIVFGLHSAGYFLGGQVTHWLLSPAGSTLLSGLSKPTQLIVAKLAWGLFYGLGFGAGIGYAFHAVQKKRATSTAGRS